jgi:hypothetical protein
MEGKERFKVSRLLYPYSGLDWETPPDSMTNEQVVDAASRAYFLSRLTGHLLQVHFSPASYFTSNPETRGHLFSVTMNTTLNDELESLEFGTLNDSDDAYMEQQIIDWLDAGIAMRRKLKKMLQANLRANQPPAEQEPTGEEFGEFVTDFSKSLDGLSAALTAVGEAVQP